MEHAAAKHLSSTCPSPHRLGHQRNILGQILDPGVNLSLWQRAALPAISRELSSLAPSQLPDERDRTSPATFKEDVRGLLRRQGLEPDDFSHLLADLAQLADVFFPLCGDHVARFRLVTTDGDNCRRFHVDTRHLRLLCTYQGPGTEWLDDAQVDRGALHSGAPNDAIIRFGETSRFEPFWVGIFRGEPGRNGDGLVHRSPPIAGTGQTRVLFSLDADPRVG